MNDASLRQYLPAQPPTGHSYVDTPFFKLDQIDEDDELINGFVEELQEECEKIASNNMARANDSQSAPATAPTDSIEIVTPTQEREQLKPAAKPTYTETDYQRARVTALGMHYDPATGKLTKPVISEYYEAIMNMTSKKDQRDAVNQTLESVEDSLAQSSNFLYRAMDLPKMSNIGASYLGQGLMASDPVTSLDINTSTGFVLNMVMPDTQAMAKEKAEAADLNYAEEAIGEHHSKKAKLDTTFQSIKEIGGLNSFLAIIANGMGVQHLLFKFDVESTAPIPSVAYYIYNLALHMTSKRARKWLKNNRADNQQLFYYVLNQVLAILACVAGASKDVLVTTAILSESLDQVPNQPYKTAHRVYESTLECIERVLLNSQEVPQSALWRSAPAKKRQDDKEAKKIAELLSPRANNNNKKDTSKERRDSDANKKGQNKKQKAEGDTSGWISCKSNNLQLPKELFNQDYHLCKSEARDDTTCPWGPKCNNDHTHFVDLDRAKQKAMVKSVDKNPKLEFVGIDEKLLEEIREEIKNE